MSIHEFGRGHTPAWNQRRWLEVYNSGAQVIPPHGAMEIASITYTAATGEIIFNVQRPSAANLTNILFNSHEEIGVGEPGAGTMDFPCVALVEDNNGSVGDVWGVQANSFSLSSEFVGFQLLGSAKTNYQVVKPVPRRWVVAKSPAGGIAAISGTTPGSASCELYHLSGGVLANVYESDGATKVSRTLYNIASSAVAASTYVQFKVDIDGTHWVDFEDCG